MFEPEQFKRDVYRLSCFNVGVSLALGPLFALIGLVEFAFAWSVYGLGALAQIIRHCKDLEKDLEAGQD